MRYIVTQPTPLSGLGMGGCQPIAGFVNHLSGQRGYLLFLAIMIAPCFRARPDSTSFQLLLQSIPISRINEGRMLARPDICFVSDTACIDRVTQDVIDMSEAKPGPPLQSTR